MSDPAKDSKPARRRGIRRYVAILSVCLAACLAATILINLWVDPWRVTPTPLHSDTFEPYRDISSQIRTGKCGLIRSAPSIGVALLGSSRVANGLDPLDSRWDRDDVYNLACPAGFFYETDAVFRYLVDRHQPELVVLGLDPGDLSSDFDSRQIGDYAGSPLGPERLTLDREIRYLAGISTLEASIQTLHRKAAGELPQYDSRGLRRRRPPMPFSQLDFLARAIEGETMFDLPDTGRRQDALHPAKVAILRDIIGTCRQRGIRLILFIHPQHALLHARSDAPPLLPFETERREITTLVAGLNEGVSADQRVELWDFGDHHPINRDPLPAGEDDRMRYWTDFNHYTLEVGGLMLARMLDWPVGMEGGEDYGTRLTPPNFDAWVERAKQGYQDYVEGAGKRDLEWKQDIIRGARGE